jgi:regulator of protease activity HflC (stomatin/prohibitin superfamily)|eukprot:Tamp_18623.p2 GENE.Tamp_18623~~Tamp_18623.p2  ORF type:complete len:176 (-),score=54.17 Tamp_18623:180-707(-)
MQKKLKDELSGVLSARGIVLEAVLLKAVTLPSLLSHSIELKAQAEQESARMEFVLTKEQQEANRKSIEAKGIADFQRIVSDGISPALLQWKGIEATEKLAAAPNSKIVFVGNSQQALPVMLSGDAGGNAGLQAGAAAQHPAATQRPASLPVASLPSLPSPPPPPPRGAQIVSPAS